jgi:hypothetical protein
MQEGRDFWWDEEAEKVQSYCPCEPVNSEDPLFILYVSLPPFSHPAVGLWPCGDRLDHSLIYSSSLPLACWRSA